MISKTKRTVVIAPTVGWDALFQLPHHIARQFAADGWEVWYGELKHANKGTLNTDRVESEPGILRCGHWDDFVAAAHGQVDLVISFRPNVAVWPSVRHLQAGKHVLWLCDDFRAWREHEEDAMMRVDGVIYSSQALADTRVPNLPMSREVPWIVLRNACAAEWCALPAPECPPEYEQIKDGGKKIALFFGYIGPWVDKEALSRIARMEGWTLVCLSTGAAPPAGALSLGQKDWEELPGYIFHADAGVIPFLDVSSARMASPVKAYEMASLGLRCVGTNVRALESMPVAELIDPEDWEDVLEEEVRDLHRLRREWALSETWEKRYRNLWRWLEAEGIISSGVLKAGAGE